LGARKKDEREKIRDKILDVLPEDHGITAKELKAKTKGICGTQALYERLTSLKASEEVLVEGSASRPLYRRRPWTGPARLAPLLNDLKSVRSEIRTINDLFARINLDFERAYYLYVRVLVRMTDPKVRRDSEITSAAEAHDLFDFFFNTQIKRPLASIAQLVWREGGNLRVGDIDPFAALVLFRPKPYLKPEFLEQISGLTISELMAKVRRGTSGYTDEDLLRYYSAIHGSMKAE